MEILYWHEDASRKPVIKCRGKKGLACAEYHFIDNAEASKRQTKNVLYIRLWKPTHADSFKWSTVCHVTSATIHHSSNTKMLECSTHSPNHTWVRIKEQLISIWTTRLSGRPVWLHADVVFHSRTAPLNVKPSTPNYILSVYFIS